MFLNTGQHVSQLDLQFDGRLEGIDRVIFEGTLFGQGVINVPGVNAGEVSPGRTVGAIYFFKDYTQESDAVLNIELAPPSFVGPFYANQYDFLEVRGIARLGGTLNIIQLHGFMPEIGESFRIVVDNFPEGQFDTVLGADFAPGRRYQVTYLTSGVFLNVVASPIPEPASILLLSPAGVYLLLRRRRPAAHAR